MSSLEDDLLRKITAFNKARDRLERKSGASLADLYERARAEVLEDLIDRFGHMDKMELQYVETVLREIERVLASYTTESAVLRSGALDQGWEIGQRLAVNTLALDSTLTPALASLQVRIGMVDRAMVSHLFGNIPQLAGKVTQDVLLRVRNELVVGAIRGESIPKLARRIAGTGLTQEGLRRPFGTLRKRGTLIARVEVIKASDAGYEDMVQRAQEVIQEKIYDLWITARDERVDPPCNYLEKDGHGPFRPVSGYPGVYERPNGPRPVLDTHLGCRCRRVPVLLRWIKEGSVTLPALRTA